MPRRGAGGPPSMVGPPSISGTATLGQTLTCDAGVWVGLLPLVVTRQWIRGASTVIPGATNATHVVAVGDQTTTVKCNVTITNYLGAVTATTPPTVTIP
jgi:hypothetical protein